VYGNFGQANYSSAKHALIGLANTLALEGESYNIKVNTIIPTAGSRLTQTVMPEELVEALKPEYVTPLTLFLAHEDCPENGQLFEAGAGWYGRVKYYKNKGKVLPNATVEAIHDNWAAISSLGNVEQASTMRDHTTFLIDTLGDVKSAGGASGGGGGSAGGASPSGGAFPKNIKSSVVFQGMADGVKEDPSAVKAVKSIILYEITDGKKVLGKFTLDFKNEPFAVYFGEVKNSEKPAATVTVADDDFVAIASGQINAQKAFMSGKLKVKGNIMLLQKLQGLADKKKKSKL